MAQEKNQSRMEISAAEVKPGMTIRVHVKIIEGNKERVQVFEGIVIARKHGNEDGATFTVRKVTEGVGVERIFPINSPVIAKIEITREAKVRQSKLYYLRDFARKLKETIIKKS